MDAYTLPATTYEVPARLARKHTLNTIMEDENSEMEDCSEGGREDNSRGRDQYLRPGERSASTSPVPSLASSISYYKSSRRSEDFDEMYDVSDDDSDIAPSIMTSISSQSMDSDKSPPSQAKLNRYPSLVIPSPSYWPTIEKAQPQTVSPPRPPKIPISPAALSMLAHNLPCVSHPPSLDGSLNSDPFAGASAPVTPELQHPRSGEVWGDVNAGQAKKPQRPELKIRIEDGSGWYEDSGLGHVEGISIHDFAVDGGQDVPDSPILGSEDGLSDVGVQLPADALETLRHLSAEVPVRQAFDSPTDSEQEMEEVELAFTPPDRPSSADITPMSQTSDYSISRLSIPSPGGFFASLGSNARHTWSSAGPGFAPTIPPSSTTAEQFYNCPWNRDLPGTVPQVVEVDDTDTEGPPTARQIPPRPVEGSPFHVSSSPQLPRTPDHDEGYERAIQETAEKSLDRTSVWLAAQTSYMSSLRETYPASEVGLGPAKSPKRRNDQRRDISLGSPIQKAVQFLESEVAKREHSSAKEPGTGESIYYHAFQHIQAQQESSDAFRHRHTRSDAIQTSRINLPEEHLAALQGTLRITHVERPDPKRPISMMPGKETEQPEETPEQKVIARVDRERQALEQVNARMWVVEAAKYLNGGKLLNSPAVSALVKAPAIGDIENGKIKSSPRVLDLGGQPNGDWAWHASQEYQHARVYTASMEQHLVDTGIRGPRNHRRVAVTELWQLPYPDNYFDAISARSLFSYLKTEKPLGQSADEYDLCLQECLRCLKPGGYLEWFMMDSEIVNAGSRGIAASVEFGFNLKTRGYDPVPTKGWLGRVRRAGFDDIKRAWTFLPVGTPTKEAQMLPETPPPNVSTFEYGKAEAVQGPVGSTADAASMSGLVGSWAWEQWMLWLHTEMGKEQLLDGVGAVLEEGKSTGAGWRCLTGWARKPLEA